MFLQLKHQQLAVYKISKAFTLECYKMSKCLPSDEKFGMISQIRRAALSVHLNIAEGCSRKSEIKRKRYFEVSRGSLIEVDAAIGIAAGLNYLQTFDTFALGNLTIECFKILCGLIDKKTDLK